MDSSIQTDQTGVNTPLTGYFNQHQPTMEETLGENELRQISEIFMSFGSHLGLGFDATAPNSQTRLEKANITWLPRLPSPSSFQCEKNPLGEDDKGWPRDRLPIELFERVIRGLSRADILNLRLVSREFEKKVSRSVFRSVVVPFRPKIYRNVATDDAPGELPPDNALTESMTSQKGKSRDNEGSYGVPYHINHVDYNGMKIFDAWGKHIQKFAMTFDIDQGKRAVFPYFCQIARKLCNVWTLLSYLQTLTLQQRCSRIHLLKEITIKSKPFGEHICGLLVIIPDMKAAKAKKNELMRQD